MNKLKAAGLMLLALMLVALEITFAVSYYGAEGDKYRSDTRDDKNEPAKSSPAEHSEASADEPSLPVFSNEKVGWGPGLETNERNQTVSSLAANNRFKDYGAYFIFPDDEGIMYLTFDLGYENGYTETILDVLKSKDVKATFFVTMDYVREAPDIVKRIVDEGHTLANHTVRHPSMPDVSDDRCASEIMELHGYIEDIYGCSMTLFRFPMGEFSERTLNIVDGLGYKSIFWSFAYKDWLTDAQPSKEYALQRITSSFHPGAILLLHAVSSTNAAIMENVIDEAAAQGYTFALIDTRLGLVETPEAIF